MDKSKIVSIGGLQYDSKTGLPAKKTIVVRQPDTAPNLPVKKVRNSTPVHAKGVHAGEQRSSTLTRRFVTKSKQSQSILPPKSRSKNIDIRPNITRSAHISKFAPEPQAVRAKRATVSDIAPKAHPVVKRAHDIQAVKQQVVKPAQVPSARDIKHAELGKALANAKTESKAPKQPRRRALNVAAATLGLLLIAGYFTYVNMPNLSVRVAAAQAGIDAKFPEYRPIGYSLNGPVAYQDGEVSMKFASNTGPVAFSLNQSRSSWDSAALLEKFVNPKSESKYATYSDGGLTIYTYGTNAAWVNGGILYTIDGTANLSNEQVRRIATSM